MKKIIVLFLMLFICCNSVFADKCSSSQIVAYQKEAAKIKVDYEIIENENLDDSIKINIYNLAEDLFIIKTDDILEEDEYLYYSSFNNNIGFVKCLILAIVFVVAPCGYVFFYYI